MAHRTGPLRLACDHTCWSSDAGGLSHGLRGAEPVRRQELQVVKFNARTGRNHTAKQLKNRWDNLKVLFNFWLACNADTGLGFDYKLMTITASDEWWELNTQGNREKKALRFGPPVNLEDLDYMFSKSKVSGLSACIPGEQVGASTINLEDEDDKNEDVFVEDPSNQRTARKGLKRKGESRSPQKKMENPVVKQITCMVDNVISSNSVTSKALHGDITREAIREVMKLAKESGVIEGTDEHFMATRLFVKVENREMLLTIETNEGRLNWLKRCYEERKK